VAVGIDDEDATIGTRGEIDRSPPPAGKIRVAHDPSDRAVGCRREDRRRDLVDQRQSALELRRGAGADREVLRERDLAECRTLCIEARHEPRVRIADEDAALRSHADRRGSPPTSVWTEPLDQRAVPPPLLDDARGVVHEEEIARRQDRDGDRTTGGVERSLPADRGGVLPRPGDLRRPRRDEDQQGAPDGRSRC